LPNEYHVGDLVHCKGVFTNAIGSLVDPSTVTVKIRKPDDTTVSYVYGASAVVHESVNFIPAGTQVKVSLA
jgi:hypothetical protein